jgi:hypothetical protein
MLRNRVAEEKSSRSFDLCAAPNADFDTFGVASSACRLRPERSASPMSGTLPRRVRVFDIAVYSRVLCILRECASASRGIDVERAELIARIWRRSGGKKIRKVVDTKKMRG